MADKKPKTGDVVGWAVVDKDMDIDCKTESREYARRIAKSLNGWSRIYAPYRIAKIVLSK